MSVDRSAGKRPKARLPKLVLDHLSESGLTVDDARIMHLSYVDAQQDKIRVPVPALRIPYFDLEGRATTFYRLRTLAESPNKKGKGSARYLQPKGSSNHLYLSPHIAWNTVARETATPIIVTEGEKKAACGCANGYPTIGLGGVYSWQSRGKPIEDLDKFAWTDRIVYIAFDSPDVQTNLEVADALNRLAVELRSRKAVVRFVHFPTGGQKVGLDDFVVQQGPEALATLLAEATDEPADIVTELNMELAIVWSRGVALVLRQFVNEHGKRDFTVSKVAEVSPGYANRWLKSRVSGKRSAFREWFESPRRREYKGLIFRPGQEVADHFNMWSGFAIVSKPGTCALFKHHLLHVVCSGNRPLYGYVFAWMAHAVQRPSTLPGTALILRGKQGAGKTTVSQYFCEIFGEHHVSVTQPDQLLGKFNLHLSRAVMVTADEAVWGGNKESEGVLKAMITDPRSLLEAKGRDSIPLDNYKRLIFTSNSDWPVPAGLEERRMVVIDVSDAMIGNADYFNGLFREMLDGGREALLYELENHDITGFKPQVFPKTSALWDVKLLSAPGWIRIWYDLLRSGYNNPATGSWEREVSCEVLHSLYVEKSQQAGESRRALESELGRGLKRAVPGLRDVRRREGSRQVRKWQFPSLEECRSAFEKMVCQAIEWPSDETEGTRTKRRGGKPGMAK